MVEEVGRIREIVEMGLRSEMGVADLPSISRLALEDGTVLRGRSVGASGTRLGEVVFFTGWTGYQEVLTDPSYAGQIVVMTAPQIGNTGIAIEDSEAADARLSGFVLRKMSSRASNWRSVGDLPSWLGDQQVPSMDGVDTRALTRKLRDGGTLKGVICDDVALDDEVLVEMARNWSGLDGADLVAEVTCEEPWVVEPCQDPWVGVEMVRGDGLTVVAYDFGMKRNIARRLAARGVRVEVVPATTPAAEVLARRPDGVLLSNGPGDPAALDHLVAIVRELLGKVPILGICLGHQLLARALGARTIRLPFGHHGGNQPVRVLDEDRLEISSHNHNFAVDPATLPAGVEVTHTNLNDGCVEGLRHRQLEAFSVQYHPEGAPGPHDGEPVFDRFIELMKAHG